MSEWSRRSRPADVKDFIRRAHEWRGSPHRVLDIALLLSDAYVALEDIDTGAVVCVVWNIRYEPDGGFAYRVADETCAPRARRCPERILRTLSDPAPSDAAARWREACWGRIITRQARPPLSDGDRIRLLQPQRFSDGVLRDEFTALRIGRTWRFESDDGAICRFDVKALDYEVIGAGAGGFDPARDA